MKNLYHYVVAIAPKNSEEINDKSRKSHELRALSVAIKKRNLSYAETAYENLWKLPRDMRKLVRHGTMPKMEIAPIGISPAFSAYNKIPVAEENVYRIDLNPRLSRKEVRSIREKLKDYDVKIFKLKEIKKPVNRLEKTIEAIGNIGITSLIGGTVGSGVCYLTNHPNTAFFVGMGSVGLFIACAGVYNIHSDIKKAKIESQNQVRNGGSYQF